MITIKYDSTCDMLLIESDGECIFEGNTLDLPSSPQELVDFFEDLGLDATSEDYQYED